MRFIAFPGCCTAKILLGFGGTPAADHVSRQAYNDHAHLDFDGKRSWLSKALDDLEKEGQTAIIFSNTTHAQDEGIDLLRQCGFNPSVEAYKEHHAENRLIGWMKVLRAEKKEARPVPKAPQFHILDDNERMQRERPIPAANWRVDVAPPPPPVAFGGDMVRPFITSQEAMALCIERDADWVTFMTLRGRGTFRISPNHRWLLVHPDTNVIPFGDEFSKVQVYEPDGQVIITHNIDLIPLAELKAQRAAAGRRLYIRGLE